MPLPNPWYIDSQARHLATQQRLLAFSAMEGREGVLDRDHLAILDLDTPGAAIKALPGAYSVLARHLGGAFEAYVGKIQIEETVPVNPTSSSGSRTDLIILRIENPYVSGSGSWAQPADPIDGPYAHVRVIEGVTPNMNHIRAYNDTWSAITLGRIDRPASTGIVTQSHITDLRSIAKLGEERIIIIENPPPAPPPVAYPIWTESTPVGNNTTHLSSQSGWHDFPGNISWQVPVPAWATGVDINGLINPEVTQGDVKGELRLIFEGDPFSSVPAGFNANLNNGTRIRDTMMLGGTEALVSSVRNKVVTMKMQARSIDTGQTGRLTASPGTRINLFLNFKRNPSYNP